MDARAALDQMNQLLAPGGTIAIVGLALSRLPANMPWAAAASCHTHRSYKLDQNLLGAALAHSVATAAQLRHSACPGRAGALPGVRYRRHPLWRYSLIWTKP